MRLAASVFLTMLVFGAGCAGEEPTSTRVAAYHLEDAWPESEPAAERGELEVPDNARVVTCGPPAAYCPGASAVPRRILYYAFTGNPALTTEDFNLESARVETDVNRVPVVLLHLTGPGQSHFRELTRRIAAAGRQDGSPHHLALVVDDRLVTAATIDYQATPYGVTSDVVEIHGTTREAASELVDELRGD